MPASNRLAAVILTLDKRRYAELKKVLASEYRLVSDRAPFVGDQKARFRKGAVTITADAPHLSFDMSIIYAHDKFESAMEAGQKQQALETRKRERAAF